MARGWCSTAIGLWPAIAARGRADPRDPRRRRRFAAVPALRPPRSGAASAAPLGYIVENRVLRRALFDRAASLPSLTLLAPRAVAAMAADDGRRRRDAGRRHAAAARGSSPPPTARTRRCAMPPASARSNGATTRPASSPPCAHERPHAGIAIEHFLPAGPFAILPMTGRDRHRSASCGPRMPIWRRICWRLPDAEFAAELRARFGDFLGEVEPVGPRWSYPLALMQAERYAGRRLALVGEAAHVIHPIAGQGLNIGIRDVAALGRDRSSMRAASASISATTSLLERYERWRRLGRAGARRRSPTGSTGCSRTRSRRSSWRAMSGSPRSTACRR